MRRTTNCVRANTMARALLRAESSRTEAKTLTPPQPSAAPSMRQPSAHLIRVPEAARIIGIPQSLLRKSFMREDRRPANVPTPPPHIHIGRAVYIIADQIPAWLETLGAAQGNPRPTRRRGRPTVAERIAQRQRSLA